MSSFNKKIQKKRYAEDRRQLQRNELEKNLRADAEQELRQYFDEQKFSNEDLIQAYPAIYEFIKRKAPNLAWKKYAHEFFRTYIKDLNKSNNLDLPLPYLTFEMKRDEPIFTLDWIQAGPSSSKSCGITGFLLKIVPLFLMMKLLGIFCFAQCYTVD